MTVRAVSTQRWELTTPQQFAAGDLHGVMIASTGEIVRGLELQATEIEDKAVWAAVRTPAGRILLGTAGEAKLVEVQGEGGMKTLHDSEDLAITCLAASGEVVYAGTMPSGKVLRINEQGEVNELADLNARYIWDLAIGVDGAIYAATGPEGKLFKINADGAVEEWYDSPEANLLSLVMPEDGKVICGTGEKGVLLQIEKKGKARALYDLPELEIRSLAMRDGAIIIGANAQAGTPGGAPGGDPQNAAEQILKNLAPEPPASSNGNGNRSGNLNGTVYRLDPTGRLQVLLRTPGEFIWRIAPLADGNVAVATGNNGRIHVVDPQQRISYVAADLAAGQIFGLITEEGRLTHLATGNGAALQTVVQGGPNEAWYRSPVLDAQFAATWGKLSHAGRGRMSFQTRSGMTAEPDATWSEWSGAIDSTPFRVGSPRGRYLQVRVNLLSDDARLRRLNVSYLPDNQPPVIAQFNVTPQQQNGGGNQPGGNNQNQQGKAARQRPLTWQVADPDGDPVAVRLYCRRESEQHWQPMLPMDQPVTNNQFQWDTSTLPDGRYVIKLVATDEQNNPAEDVQTAQKISEAVLVDNSSPRVRDLSALHEVTTGKRQVIGRAIDNASLITRLAFQVNGGSWQVVFPEDRLFDDQEESFAITLPKDLAQGAHTVAVKATDEAGNQHVGAVVVRVQ
jgi:outer membrane protein assembly factor BamB